jgi:3-oxoacyl-[acyl-carrier protein] reductase
LDLGINGRVALVLGASGGLGSAICSALAAEGVSIIAVGRKAAELDALVGRLSTSGGHASRRVCDLSDRGAVAGFASELGPVDILVNITGGPPPTPASGQPTTLWEEQFQAMVLSVISLTDAVLPGMKERGWGRIITSTSSGIVAPIANLAISNALRMSLVGWSKSLSREVGKFGVTANIVVPGRIETDRIRYLDERRAEREGRSAEDVSRESANSIPVGRYGTPHEYAAAVAFLASRQASYVTGSILRVDGGLIPSV